MSFYPDIVGSAGEITVTAGEKDFSISMPGGLLGNVKPGYQLQIEGSGAIGFVDTIDDNLNGTLRLGWGGASATTDQFHFHQISDLLLDMIEAGLRREMIIERIQSFTPDRIWEFDTDVADSDQGAGKVWLNNASPAAATKVWLDDLDFDARAATAWIGEFDRTDSNFNGYLTLRSLEDHGSYAVFAVVGDVVAKAGYQEVPVDYVEHGGALSGRVTVSFTPAAAGAADAAAQISAASAKATPADADLLGLVDSEASNALKKLSWANLKATIRAGFNALTGQLMWPADVATIGVPTFGTRSAGTRLVLWPALSGSAADFALGMASSEIWVGVPAVTGLAHFSWYAGTTEVARLKDNGDLLLDGAIVPGTGQVVFPATQVASADPNTLDDYEEGSFTPTLTSSGTAPTGVVYTQQIGRYTKIGQIVHFFAVVIVTSKGTGATGDARVAGLPFTVAATGTSVFAAAARVGNINLSAGYTQFALAPLITTTQVTLTQQGSNVPSANIPYANLTDTSVLLISGTYFV